RNLVRRVADIVRHARGKEKASAGCGTNALMSDLPVALAFQDVERLLLHAMDMKARREAGRNRPLEHRGVSRVAAGDQKCHGLTGKPDLLAFTGSPDDRLCIHRARSKLP